MATLVNYTCKSFIKSTPGLYRLVPSRYLSVFWGERRLGIRLRRTRGLVGREEGKIATLFFVLNFP